MGLLEDLTTIGSYRTGGKCAIGRIYSTLVDRHKTGHDARPGSVSLTVAAGRWDHLRVG